MNLRVTTRAWLAGLVAILALPASVLADAVRTGDPNVPVDPGLGPLLGVLQGVVGLGAAIVVLVGLGVLVGRLGAPVPTGGTTGSAVASATGSHLGRNLSVLAAAMAAIFGILAGRAIAYEASQGSLHPITAAIYGMLVGVLVVALVVIGVVAIVVRRGHASRAIATVFASAGLLVAGAFGGGLTARASGATYHEPVVSEAAAEVHVRLAATSVPFAAQDGGQASCRSVPDSRTVSSVSGLDLGELGPGTLRVGFTLGTAGSGTADTELFIDAGDLPEGSPLVSWTGTVAVTTTNADGSAGQLTFSNLALSNPAAKDATGASDPTSALPGWPAMLSGSISWTCQPW